MNKKQTATSKARGRNARPTSADVAGFVKIIEWLKTNEDITSLSHKTIDDALLAIEDDLTQDRPRSRRKTLEQYLRLAIGDTESDKSDQNLTPPQATAASFFCEGEPQDVSSSVDIFLTDSKDFSQVGHLADFLSTVVEQLILGDVERAKSDCEMVIDELFKRSDTYRHTLKLYKVKGSITTGELMASLVSEQIGGDA